MILQCRDITKQYGTLQVLKGVSLDVERGEIVSIVGSSGAGKSTLLHILGTLDKPDGGTVMLNGEQVNFSNRSRLADFRNRELGFVFQFHHLLPEFTALENVSIPGYIQGKAKKEVESKAEEILRELGLGQRLHHKPAELSGGEQQRVAVARALINDPALVLADEPSGNLDSENSHQLHQLFLDLRDRFGQTFIIVTHNKELANLSDRQLIMSDGQISA
jgi:lipoprotein-releasing system ATP-binding protein